jgi:hypothetical protein
MGKNSFDNVMLFLTEMNNYRFSSYNRSSEQVIILSRETSEAYTRGNIIRKSMFNDYNSHQIIRGILFDTWISKENSMYNHYNNIGRSMDLYGDMMI